MGSAKLRHTTALFVFLGFAAGMFALVFQYDRHASHELEARFALSAKLAETVTRPRASPSGRLGLDSSAF